MKTKPLFTDEFLEDMADIGVEVTDVFDTMHDVFVRLRDLRRRDKRGMVMRNYPSAFDRVADSGL